MLQKVSIPLMYLWQQQSFVLSSGGEPVVIQNERIKATGLTGAFQ